MELLHVLMPVSYIGSGLLLAFLNSKINNDKRIAVAVVFTALPVIALPIVACEYLLNKEHKAHKSP